MRSLLTRGVAVATFIAALAVGVAALPESASAESCLPAGGAAIPAAVPAAGEFQFTGRGWGHGVGMSQYGARGAARLGCTVEQILTTYFPGVTVERGHAIPEVVRVRLYPVGRFGSLPTSIGVTAQTGAVEWHMSGLGSGDEAPPEQPAGSTWTVRAENDGSFKILQGTNEIWAGGTGDVSQSLQARHDGTVVRVVQKNRRYKHGRLEFHPASGAPGRMTLTSRIPSMEKYLYGLAEMPSSWEPAALQAQAVAGRSYAASRGSTTPTLYDSVDDQAYTGYEKESEGAGAVWGARWVAAVDATAGTVMRHGGRTVSGNYASSHGGRSESSEFVWGGSVPYLQSIDDSRWDQHSGNPYRTWSASFSGAELGQRFANAGVTVGDVVDIQLPEPRGGGHSDGRIGTPARGAGGAVIVGTTATRTVSGDVVRFALGLRSTWFDVNVNVETSCLPPPGADLSKVGRLSGPDRIATAVEVSKQFASASSVVLASSADFPDALAGARLAAELDAPLLLTRPNALPAEVAARITALQAEEVFVVGGSSAVSEGVLQAAAGMSGVTKAQRVRGGDRFETAAAIASMVASEPGRDVVLALGRHADPDKAWPDAVAAGALLAAPDAPVLLLTDPDRLPAATERALDELDPGSVLIIGGEAAIAASVQAQVEALGHEVAPRLSGANRYATSAKVAEEALARRGGTAPGAVFATGRNFPDALTAGALGAHLGYPVLLVPDCDLSSAPAMEAFLGQSTGFSTGFIVGGAGAVSDLVRWQLGEEM